MYGWMVFQNFSGVDEKTTLSWKYTGEGEDAFQKSCRIRVKDAQGRISDTGEMETERHQGMPFPDMEWRSFTEYQVQVEGKDRGGNLTESGWITFVTGALVPEDFQGQWIGTGEGKPFYARKRWNLTKKVKSAYALVCGLGQFRFYINGKKVSDHELDPGWTNYDRKVQYVMFDIAPYLREGENVFGVSVGNGFYLGDKGGRYFFEMPPEAMKRFMPPNTNGYRPFGDALPLKGMFLLRYADGSSDVICTDSLWKVRRSACQLANVYGSEICDAATDQYSADTAENGLDGKPFFRGAGFLPPIAPSYGKFIADTPLGNFWDLIAWGSFLILGAKWFYEYYGDLSMIRNYYGANCAYMDYLGTKITEDGFIAHGLGDWGNPQAGAQATANVETAFYYKDLVTMAEFAGLLGKQEDEKRFKDLAEEVRGNYNEKLLVKDPAGRWCYRAWDHREELFCTQACQALPLHFGMVPEDKKKDVTDTLLELLEPSGFVSGEIGFPAILQCLQESGHQDLIWKLAMREDTFSFYHFVQTGETALGEYWEDNPRSHNHDMMGSLMECYYTGIAGIRGLEPGFARAEIRPYLPNGIKRMKCSYGSAQGVVALEVDTAGADGAGAKTDTGKADGAGADGRGGTVAGGVTVSVVIPAGMEAELDLTALGLDVREHLIPGRYRFAPR